jgi:type I restriction enzyme S subunit
MASVKDMTRYGFDFTKSRKISEEDFIKLNKNGCSPQIGDLLIGKDGARYLEDMFVFRQKVEVVVLSSIAILRPDLTKIIPEFMFYYLNNNYMKKFIKNNYGSGSAIPRMVLRDFKKVPIYIPNMIQQKSIAHILSTLDEKIEVNNQINKTLENMAQAIFKQWFVDFEFPNEDGEPYKSSGGEMVESELGMIPNGWEVKCVSNMGDVVGGATPSKKREDFFANKGIPWITPKDLSLNKDIFIGRGLIDITQEGFENSSTKFLPKGTVLFSSRAPIGYIAISINEVTTNQGFKSIIPNRDVGFSKEFIYCWLKSNLELITNRASGSTFKEVSGTVLKGIPAVIPDLVVLQKFEELTKNIFDMIRNNEKEINILKRTRDTLLPKLMSGEIRVPLKSEGESS